MTWILHEGDCLEVMHIIQNESIDAVITDPPYGIDYQSARRIDPEARFPKISNDTQPFIWWLFDAYRITKNNGALICFCRWDVQEAFKQAIEWAGFNIKSQVVWDRGIHGMGDLKGGFAPCHDIIWFATKGKGFEFPGKRPQSVIKSNRLSGSELLHPNEKPVDLMGYLISCVTPRNGAVLDPFAGSGSTLVAGNAMDYNMIGIEIDEDYCKIIRKRMENTQTKLFMDLA